VKILITGATGYVGGRLLSFLLSQGHEVIGVSRRDVGTPIGWPTAAPLFKLNALELDAKSLELFQNVDVVIHLAAANEIRSAEYPDEAMLETGGGTRRLVEASISQGVRRFIFLSTVHVYGNPLAGNYTEASIPYPAHPYAISHKVGEDYLYAAHSAKKIEGISVRLSNSIGAPAWSSVDRWTLVGNDLTRQAITTGQIIIKSPNQWRDFIAMKDVCAGINILTHTDQNNLGNGIFNLSGEMPLRIIDLAERIATSVKKVTGSSVEVLLGAPLERSDSPTYSIGSAKLKSLGYIPSDMTGLDEELVATATLVKNAISTN
jgi:UDP-glucose 4-epimerase